MRLLTIHQHETLLNNGSPENTGKDHFPVVKLFMPGTAYTWLLTEIDPEYTNMAFGLCDLGMSFPELGYVDLEELMQARTRLGLGVELDASFKASFPLSVYAQAASSQGLITEDHTILRRFSKP